MSYILEALKKSQQQRDLGRVPTLDQGQVFEDDKEPVTHAQWGLLAVGLAAVAVVIALYAALRPMQAPILVSGEGAVASQAEALARASAGAADPAMMPTQDGVSGALGPPRGGEPEVSGAGAEAGEAEGEASQPMLAPPASSPPGSRQAAGSEREAVQPVAASPTSASLLDQRVALPGDSGIDPLLEQELWRQLEAETESATPPQTPPPAAPRRPQRAAVPPELVADIEAFKQQVRREQGLPPPPAQRAAADIQGDPTKLRLTPLQQAQVPAYFMTVHVFDEDPAKRFVHINALRYGEGEETRDGLRVERIIPQGAVLSYMGNPFFVRR